MHIQSTDGGPVEESFKLGNRINPLQFFETQKDVYSINRETESQISVDTCDGEDKNKTPFYIEK